MNYSILMVLKLNRKVSPKINKKVFGVIGVTLILIILTGVLLNQYWRIADLEATNYELSMKLENATRELESLQKNHTDVQNNMNTNLKPPIVTRLGTKLVDMYGGRYGDNYLWVTGEIQNMGNLTAYNVQLILKFYTNNGIQVKQFPLGTLKPHETISIRTALVSEIGTIKSWELEPVATYEP